MEAPAQHAVVSLSLSKTPVCNSIFLFIFLGFIIIIAPKSQGQSETASLQNTWSHYSDKNYFIQQVFLNYAQQFRLLSSSQDQESRLSLGFNQKKVVLQNKDSKSREVFDGRSGVDLQSWDADLGQNIQSWISLGILGGISRSQITNSHYHGLRVSAWWLSDTVQTTLEYRINKLNQLEMDFTDVDGKRIQTPRQVNGSVLSAQIMQYISKTSLINYGYSQTLRSDRPDAWGAQAELRQYAPQLDGALHLGYSRFEDTTQVEAQTSYGQMSSHTFYANWLQKWGMRYLHKTGYRFHQELENPRAKTGLKNQLGSDYIFSSVSYRLQERLWTQTSSEVSFLYGHYRNNQENRGHLLSLGGTYLF